MQQLNWKPNTNLEKAGLEIVRLLNDQNYQAFFVGGIVRDYILKRTSDNLDIATDCEPDVVEQILEDAKIPFKKIGKKFGTILAIPNGDKLEITTFRRESRYSDQRHPDQVRFVKSYLDDAQRRDLTINALYFNPVSRQVFDPVNASLDLKRRIIRFVGNPKKRINEDSLRMLRAVRLACVLEFKLEKNSFAAIKTRAKLIQNVSGERIKTELDKILLSKNPGAGLRLLDQTGLSRFILPELSELKKVFHRSTTFHLEGSVFEHTLKAVDILPEHLDLRYAGLFHDIGKVNSSKKILLDGKFVFRFIGHQKESQKIFAKFTRKYKFSRRSRVLIDWLIAHHDDRPNYKLMTRTKQITYSLHEDFPYLLQLWRADSAANIRLNDKGEKVEGSSEAAKLGNQILQTIKNNSILIKKLSDGNFIMQITKLKPGIRVGEISEKIKVKILTGEIKNELDAKNFLKKFVKNT